MLLLPNGDVMAQGGGVSANWYELTPSSTGSYTAGTWSQLASMSVSRLYTGSVVMGTDQVFVVGGEYSGTGGFNGTGEIYDIATDSWKSTASFPLGGFGDDPTVTLPNGNILAGYYGSSQTFLYSPSTDSWSPGPTKLDGDASDEETWVKLPASAALPQGGILTYSIFASTSAGKVMGQVYDIKTNTWKETTNSASNPPALLSGSSVGYELGGGVVLPNGLVLQIGANGFTDLYDPSTNTWSAGPQVKDSNGTLFGADDAPASILPDGQVVFAADEGPTLGTFSAPTKLFDYDYTTNTITLISGLPALLSSDLTGSPAYISRTLVLPNGQLLFNDASNLFVFTPSDSPQSAWKPTITNVVNNGSGLYTLTGTKLSGLSEGSSYGDDVNVSENYPLIQLTASNGNVYYATTSNWSNPGVSAVTDNTAETVQFTLPKNLPVGTFQLSVIANGIASTAQSFTPVINAKVTANGPYSVPFSFNSQKVTLSASITPDFGSQTVTEGTVLFTVKDSQGNTVGFPVQGNVISGRAISTFTVPANLPLGNYTINVSYTDNKNIFIDDNTDTPNTLTVTSSQVNAAVGGPVTTTFSSNNQTVSFSALVTDDSHTSDTVTEGSVTFTVRDSKGNVIGSPTQANVTNGAATATFTVPGNVPLGTYTVGISYLDSNGRFSDDGLDPSSTLTVGAAQVKASAGGPFTTTFSTSNQTVMLSAVVTDDSHVADTVTEGTVIFSVKDSNGKAVGSPVQGTVSGGVATATFTLPASEPLGPYTVAVSYGDSKGLFADDGQDPSGTLLVTSAQVKAAVSGPFTAPFSTNNQNVTLRAVVTDDSHPTDIVNRGIVTFTVTDSKGNVVGTPAQGVINNGTGTATFTLPGNDPVGNYTVAVSYSDAGGDFSDDKIDATGTLTTRAANVHSTAAPVQAIYSTNQATVFVNASIADATYPADVVNEGVVTFTLMNGSTVLGTPVQANVSAGQASTSITIPAGEAAGNYTLAVSYSDGLGNFTDGGDTSDVLTDQPAAVTTTASNLSVGFSPNQQTLTLNASVADAAIPRDTVGEGVVTFTVQNGSTTLGSVQGTVSGGLASATFNLTAGQPVGSYTIATTYSDSAGNFTNSGNTNATLNLTPANVITTASPLTTIFSPNAQTLTLNAALTDSSLPSDTVNEGNVTFTVQNGSTVVGTVQGSVSGGKASANFTLPGGAAAGTYTITTHYNDKLGNFADSVDNSAPLATTPAYVATTPANVSASYNTSAQTVSLNAAVGDSSVPGDIVNEGTVTFTISNGQGVLGTVQGGVSGGKASANFALPAGLAAGDYIITSNYSDSQGNFTRNANLTSVLTLNPATTTTQLTQVTLSPNYLAMTATESLFAHVNSSTPITQGTVTFTVGNLSVAANVDANGNATATLTAPMISLFGPQTISVHYADPANNLTSSSDTETASWQVLDALLPSSASFSPVSQIVAANTFVLMLIYSYNSLGQLSELDLGYYHFVFTYNADNVVTGITMNGLPLL